MRTNSIPGSTKEQQRSIRLEKLRIMRTLAVICCLISWKTVAAQTTIKGAPVEKQSCIDTASDTCSSPVPSKPGIDENESFAQMDNENKESSWKWKPEAEHRCNIERLTYDELFEKFGPSGVPALYHSPLVIRNNPGSNKTNQLIIQKTSQEQIVQSFPTGFQVTLSSANSYSARRRTIPLENYIQEVLSSETLPHHRSNETWYLFGETFSDEWKEFLKEYELPPCQTCTSMDLVALSFGIGNLGSGAQWHIHGPGFSHALHGRKHWVLYPPKQKPIYHPDQTSRNWMEYTYTSLKESELPYECTLEPGDLIYFPDEWHHAIINLDRYTAFVSTFTTEHNV